MKSRNCYLRLCILACAVLSLRAVWAQTGPGEDDRVFRAEPLSRAGAMQVTSL